MNLSAIQVYTRAYSNTRVHTHKHTSTYSVLSPVTKQSGSRILPSRYRTQNASVREVVHGRGKDNYFSNRVSAGITPSPLLMR